MTVRWGKRAFVAALGLALAFAALVPARALTIDLPGSEGSEIRIVRDRYGVPHVYGETAEDAAYGVGYALAQDRLWQMHVFRNIAKGRLSDILGPVVIDIDREIRFSTYTAEERAARFARADADLRAMLEAFVDGVNAHIAEVRLDPSQMPFEFVEFGELHIEDWTVDDSVALQDLLILSFGAGGGNELRHAELLSELIDRFGAAQGQTMFDDLVLTVDDDGPITIPTDVDYASEPTFARDGESEAHRALTADARLGLTGGDTASVPPAPDPSATGTAAQLALVPDVEAAVAGLEPLERGREALERVFRWGSNAQIVGPSLTEAGNTAQTAGPQVGYLLPQWLADFGMHTADGRIDTTGMTFAGAGPAVLIGRGPGFAWTTTTGSSDLSDTYVETLHPDDPHRYLWNGEWEEMECRVEEYTFRGVAFETQEICRTRHGPVFAFDEANGVAYSLRNAWFDREDQTVEGFFRYNEVTSVEDFATFAGYLASNHNMFYVDDQGNYGYWHPGNHPVRAEGVDLRLPQDGSGGSEWQGLTPVQDVPHAVNFERGWLANWNNQPAAGWPRERAWPALDNADDLYRTLDPSLPAVPDPDPKGGLVNADRLVDFEDLSANLRYAAMKDHRDTAFRPFLPADGALTTDLARDAAAVVRAWDGFNTDDDGDGLDDSAGRTIVDTWVSRMRSAAFNDDLGDLAGWAREDLLWHLLTEDDTVTQDYDWLNGEPAVSLAARAFEDAVASLAAQFGNEDPSSWRGEVDLEHYQRLNADLFTDLGADTAGEDTSQDTGIPGDVRDHIEMDRGTYNHVVEYVDPPATSGPLGQSRARAGSVIPPGQSGFIDLAGRESPHYEDQLTLYEQWRYKPMPLTLAEARAVAESEVVITRP